MANARPSVLAPLWIALGLGAAILLLASAVLFLNTMPGYPLTGDVIAASAVQALVGIGIGCWTIVYWRRVLAWRSDPDRVRPLNPCPACGYDLTGNTTGVCPECGPKP